MSQIDSDEDPCARIILPKDIGTDLNFKRVIVWPNATVWLLGHLCGLYGFYLCFHCKLITFIWAAFVAVLSSEGVTMGAHRLYAHKAYKATPLLRFILVTLQTIAGQNSLYEWVRDHRLHHKYSDTDADPHNATRGFFFSHVGWLMSRKHPLVKEKGKLIDMSDLQSDPFVMFQKKYYKILYILMAYVLPVHVPIHFWNESYVNALFVCYFFRNIFTLNGTWCINSVTHMFGNKPYDRNILAVETVWFNWIALGEAYHNYHHVFPQDYKAHEGGLYYAPTTFFIDMCAYFGLAYDLKEATPELIKKTIVRHGDGSHVIYGTTPEPPPQEEEVKRKTTDQLHHRSQTARA